MNRKIKLIILGMVTLIMSALFIGIVKASPTPLPYSTPPGFEATPTPTVAYTPTPTPSPEPQLLSFNKSMIDNFNNKKAKIDINVLNNTTVKKYFLISRKIARTFLIIAVMCAIIALFYSGDYFTSAKIKIVIRDMLFSIFMILTSYYWIGYFIQGSNLFYALWDSDFHFSTILIDFGIVKTALIGLTNSGLLVVLALVMVLGFFYEAFLQSTIYILEVGIVLFPIAQALFPIKFFRKFYFSTIALMTTILLIFPISNLFFLLGKSTLTNNTFSFDSITALFALLIVVVVAIPGAAIAAFSKIFNFINNQ